MEVIEFRFIETSDKSDEKYDNWSRTYEYPMVYDKILELSNENDKPTIHNSSWGHVGIHVKFRDELDMIGDCIHSDMVDSEIRETLVYDITKENVELNNKFDFVINISTIEHIPSSKDRILALNNLYNQLRIGGNMLVTFDYPRVNLSEIEEWCGKKCIKGNNIISGVNSIIPNKDCSNLNIVFLHIKK